MNAFDVAQAFFRQYRRDAPLSDLVVSFQLALGQLGFRYFACWSHVNPLRPPPRAVVLHSYPRDWIHRYSDSGLYAIDPVSQWAGRTLVPFSWDEERFCASLSPSQQSLLALASRFGIERGYTVPIHVPHGTSTHPASCSVIPAESSLPAEHYAVVQLMALPLFEAARNTLQCDDSLRSAGPLSGRERDCLRLAAQGKSDWVTGKILGISERTVHNHIENAKRRLRVTTRVQAIVQALGSRQIALAEVLHEVPGGVRIETPITLGHPHSVP